jgi:hypothetical protein
LNDAFSSCLDYEAWFDENALEIEFPMPPKKEETEFKIDPFSFLYSKALD